MDLRGLLLTGGEERVGDGRGGERKGEGRGGKEGKGGGRGPISSAGPGPPKHVKTALEICTLALSINRKYAIPLYLFTHFKMPHLGFLRKQ